MENKSQILQIKNENFSQVESFAAIQIPQMREKENKQKGWINCGDDNKFPNYLISLLSKSPIHSAIVKKKAMLIGGRGFITTNIGTDTLFFLKNSNNSLDLEEILHRVAYDFEVFGAFALNIVWSKDRQKISEINYIDVSKIRVAIPDETEPEVESYFYSDGWENIKKYPPVKYDGFSTINRKSASQIWYVRDHRAGVEFYGMPEYISGIFWMEMQIQISQFHLANINNGFHPSFHINWPISQNFSDEEMDTLVNRLKKQFQGSINAGETFLTIADSDTAPSITPIQANTSDDRYVNLQELIERNIQQSHRVNNPDIFGLPQPQGLGGASAKYERIESVQEFEIDYVIPKQQFIEKVFNTLARINGITDHLFINKYTDQYKKVGSDSATEVLSIISSPSITTKQKYTLLISLNYTHQLAMDLSGFVEGNDLKVSGNKPQAATQSHTHNHKFNLSREDGPCDIHINCRCNIENGIFVYEPDCCEECKTIGEDFNSK